MNETVNILVVDDSPSWCAIYQEMLSEAGYSVHIATDLAQALESLNQRFFHVVIVDIRLDNHDRDNVQGIQVLQRVWELYEGTMAIVSSAYATAEMLPTFMSYGVFDFVAKRAASPDDLARQYRSAAFIRGTIDKTGSLDESLKRIEQAALEARRIATSQKWLVSPFRVFKGFNGREVQTLLKGAGIVELRPFLGRLSRPLYPWLHGTNDVLIIRDEACEVLALESYLWSRALGEPVVIRLGRRELFARSLEQAPFGAGWHDAQVGEPIIRLTSAHFEGAVCSVLNKSFADSFYPPVPRRVSRTS
ncbi:MAG: response regulator [Anaerolineae bacterium]